MNADNQEPGMYIDLAKYPIHQLDTKQGQELIDRCQKMMATDSICVLPGFLRPQAVEQLAAEISALEPRARQLDHLCTIYGWMDNSGFPKDHVRSTLLRRHCRVLTTEQVDRQGNCFQLYQLDQLTEFVRRLLGFETLYRTACPTLSIQINVMSQGEDFGWHFDTNDGVVSFIIQNADQGGGFEYQPMIRSEDDENYAAIERIVDGVDTPRQPDLTAGTFTLFMGRRSVHRVATVGRTTKNRQSLLFSYDREPDMVFPKKTCERFTHPSTDPYLGASA